MIRTGPRICVHGKMQTQDQDLVTLFSAAFYILHTVSQVGFAPCKHEGAITFEWRRGIDPMGQRPGSCMDSSPWEDQNFSLSRR
jgi:hypothetical protein